MFKHKVFLELKIQTFAFKNFVSKIPQKVKRVQFVSNFVNYKNCGNTREAYEIKFTNYRTAPDDNDGVNR